MDNFKTNTQVKWDWGNGEATGKIVEKFTEKVTKNINGSEVVRDADSSEPAYLIEQDDGQEVLKSASELTKVN